jgi:hypothetical protein
MCLVETCGFRVVLPPPLAISIGLRDSNLLEDNYFLSGVRCHVHRYVISSGRSLLPVLGPIQFQGHHLRPECKNFLEASPFTSAFATNMYYTRDSLLDVAIARLLLSVICRQGGITPYVIRHSSTIAQNLVDAFLSKLYP